jgi:NAD(P)-dependent dehydrogenase (short-subunit alcohol dehydrogenase family)
MAIKAAQMSDDGSITLFFGISSRKPRARTAALCAINAAVETLGRALAVELAPVRVNVVAPGIIDTDAWSSISDE